MTNNIELLRCNCHFPIKLNVFFVSCGITSYGMRRHSVLYLACSFDEYDIKDFKELPRLGSTFFMILLLLYSVSGCRHNEIFFFLFLPLSCCDCLLNHKKFNFTGKKFCYDKIFRKWNETIKGRKKEKKLAL